jgi:cytochrome subunit of sulfide dehydrogenase
MRFRSVAAAVLRRKSAFRLTGAGAGANVEGGSDRQEDCVRGLSLLVAAVAIAAEHVAFAQAGANIARNLAATCTSCHGTNGVSQSDIPSLAGTPKADLVRKLQDFKSEAQAGTVMPQLAKGYTDDQIELIAGWFAAQKATK